MSNPTEDLCDVVEVERLDRYLFRSLPAATTFSHIFGGQVLAQSLYAAACTVDKERRAHSMHAYFLRQGDIHQPIIFEVDPIRDGGSFTTRRVVAVQAGKALFNTSISFLTDKEGTEHQEAQFEAPPFSALKTDQQQIEEELLKDPGFTPEPAAEAFRAFEFRTNGQLPQLRTDGGEARQGMWLRTSNPVEDNHILNSCLLAFASDMRLMGTALIPHGLNFSSEGIYAASLDHALWLHRPINIGEWLYYDMKAPTAVGGRGLNFGHFFNVEGQLVASTAQEGLVRFRTDIPL